MKQIKFSTQLKNLVKENEKGRKRDSHRLFTTRVPIGREDDAFSAGSRRVNIDTFGISSEKGKVYIGEGKRDKIYYILGRIRKDKITETAKENLKKFVEIAVKQREKEFVDFFNNAGAISKRVHQIELLPGMGKKYMHEILEQRNIKLFESFEDIKKRISNLPFPEKAIEKRIFLELTEDERHNLFTN